MLAGYGSRGARLLNEYQRGLPLASEPYAVIARELGIDEAWVRATLARWIVDGTVSRVGAVFRPGTIGVSTLAALAVPDEDLDRVAAIVSARREVNHNYERGHRLNLWFVATAAEPATLDGALRSIERDTGYLPISLPLVADYWIDLGFDLEAGATKHCGRSPRRVAIGATGSVDRRIIAALERGLTQDATPYATLAREAGTSETYVLARLADWLDRGVVKRLGVVVRHRALGYTANAMCVWDVPDANVDAAGAALSREDDVTLCYRRERSMPDWPYNLFVMIHGRDRAVVAARCDALARAHGLDRFAHAVLFSRRAFKQRGARYALAPDAAVAA
jgi:DNA-binding Lrp family transcriptional regulator